jgi:FkbM family methyltransferase
VAETLNWRADLIVQVGVGQYHQEVDVLKEEWPSVSVVGFEPLAKLVGAYPGVLRHMALGSARGEATLQVKKHHKDGSSLYPLYGMNDCEAVPVQVSTLDDEVPIPQPTTRVLLWVDCEGSELEVLKGGENFIRYVQVINIEMTGKVLGEGWATTRQIHQWMVEHGFFAQWTHTGRIASGQCDTIYVRAELFRSEYCCFPTEIDRFLAGRS